MSQPKETKQAYQRMRPLLGPRTPVYLTVDEVRHPELAFKHFFQNTDLVQVRELIIDLFHIQMNTPNGENKYQRSELVLYQHEMLRVFEASFVIYQKFIDASFLMNQSLIK
jgi:hypothetical protein